jgi:tRNA-dihydrouridine synthase B
MGCYLDRYKFSFNKTNKLNYSITIMGKFKLRNLILKNRIFLAPMLEPNDIAFRLLCKRAGCGLTFTGMTSSLSKKKIILDDKPALQLFANSTKGIENFINKYDRQVSMWDFNLGCPSKLSRKLGHGAFMHKDLKKIIEIFQIIRKSTKKPCSVKLRKSSQTVKIAKIAEDCGFDLVIIHPRTFCQGYSGLADYLFAKELKKSVSIPVCYSGDVNFENINDILKDFDFVMVGRSAIGRPCIFSDVLGKKCKINFFDYLKLSLKYKLYFRQIKSQAMNFTKCLDNAKRIRENIIGCRTVEDIKKVFNLGLTH